MSQGGNSPSVLSSQRASTSSDILLQPLTFPTTSASREPKDKNGSFSFLSLLLRDCSGPFQVSQEPWCLERVTAEHFTGRCGHQKNQASTLTEIGFGREAGSKGSIHPQLQKDTKKVESVKRNDCAIQSLVSRRSVCLNNGTLKKEKDFLKN